MNNNNSGIVILGGTFNPLHITHLRLALEAREALNPWRLDFLPSARPPHKAGTSLLPFNLRCRMLEECIKPYPDFFVNKIEEERNGLSYTYDTLLAYKAEYPEAPLFFILGAEDFIILDTWHKWREMAALCTLVVATRQDADESAFTGTVQRLWPNAVKLEQGTRGCALAFKAKGQAHVCYLPMPRLDINSSLVRKRWNDGRSIDFLVPPAVSIMLQEHSVTVNKYWSDTLRFSG